VARAALHYRAVLASLLTCFGCGGATKTVPPAPAQPEPEPLHTKEPELPCLLDRAPSGTGWSTGKEWMTARSSTFRHFPRREDFQCLRDLGCPFSPVRPPPCSQEARALKRCLVADIRRLSAPPTGKLVVLEGGMHLATRGPVYLLECPEGCCAKGCCVEGDRGVFVGHKNPPGDVQLLDTRKPEAFTCQGDDSRFCCGFELESRVIAVGTWISGPERAGRDVLLNPSLCALRTTEED
jgi:hypothetical protein